MAGATVAAQSSDERNNVPLEVRNFFAEGIVESMAGRGNGVVCGDRAAHTCDEAGTAAQKNKKPIEHGSVCLLQPFRDKIEVLAAIVKGFDLHRITRFQ